MSYLSANSIGLITILNLLLFFNINGQEGQVEIAVKDPLNSVVSKASVSLYRDDQKVKQNKTDVQGTARFAQLTTGNYRIVVISKGFVEHHSAAFELKAAETKKIAIVLEIAPIESEVEIGSSDSIEADDYGMVTILTAEDIARLPDDPLEFLNALRRIVGESITGGDLPISVNGLSGQPIPPKQLIEQIRVDRNPFSAKNTGVDGGGVQIYTSASVKTFKGSAGFNFADSRLNSKNPFLARAAPSQLRNYRFNLTGPLRGRTSFSVSASRFELETSSIINATVLDAGLQPSEFKETVPSVSRNNSLNLIINSSPSKKHKLTLAYNLLRGSGKGQGINSLTLPERAIQNKRGEQSVAVSDIYLASPNFVNKFRGAVRFDHSRIFGASPDAAINVADAFFSGGAASNSSRRNWSLEFADDATRQIGKLSLDFGVGLKALGTGQNSSDGFNGTYTFNGRIAPLLDADNNPLFDAQGRMITGQITSLESYRRTLLLRRLGYSALQIRQLGGGADQFSIAGGNPAVSASQVEINFYLQASYPVRKNLGLSFGLRYENQNNINSPLNLAPRFSLIWSPKQKKTQKDLWSLPRISAGVGLHYQRFGLSNIISIRQTNETDRAYYFISAANALDSASNAAVLNSFPNAPSLDSLEKLALTRSRRTFAAGIQTPYSFTSNVTVNKKLPAKSAVVLSLTYLSGYRQYLSRNINAPLAGTFDPLNLTGAVYPFKDQGNIYETSSKGRSDSINTTASFTFPGIKFRKRSLNMSLRYTFIKSRDNLTYGSGSPFDAYDFSREFAPTSSDGMQTLTGNFNLELPFRIMLAGNWVLRSGTRFNITTGRDSNGDGVYNERPSFAANPLKTGIVKTKYGLLDPHPEPGDKIIPRNLGRGPGSADFNLNLTRSIGFKRTKKNDQSARRSLSISMLINNVFNITNPANPIGNMSSPRFIRIISSDGDSSDETYSRSSPRSINFSLNFNF